jgi:two-component system, NarL family, sensor kinase
MQKANEAYDYLVMFVSISFLFLVLGAGISVFVVYYYRKRRAYVKEKVELQTQFERSLLQAQLEIQEHTLNHISQEIHDNVGQILSLTKMQLNILGEHDNLSRPTLQAAKDSLGKAMKDLRDLAKGLNTDRIGHFGLIENVNEELDRIQNSHSMEVLCTTTGVEHPIPEEKKLITFRMIQECLQNILKHANTKKIALSFAYTDTSLHITVQDNGIGFHVPSVMESSKGLGLRNIVNRASIVGGSASITSTLSEGTTVKITIPYA